MLRFLFVLFMALGMLVGGVVLIMSIRRIRVVVTGLFSLYAVLTLFENPFRALIILGVLYIINGTVKDIKDWFHNSDIFYDPPEKPKVKSDTEYIKATIVDSEEYYSKHRSNSKNIIKY